MISPSLAWTKVDCFTAYQRVSAEIQIRARLRETLNDPEPLFHLRNVTSHSLLPGVQAVEGVPEGLFAKAHLGAITTLAAEPPPPDDIANKTRRFVLFQGETFSVKGTAEFPAAADPHLHQEMLLKGRFFQLLEATLTVVGVEAASWTAPSLYVNRDLMLALYLG
ncbi:MAG TPA: hypothetical protein VK131_06450 [Candidatus Acidoferrales bacterium]|nr:hypothetical protein [Candidatus Acidoferrales bacterium]